MGTSLITNSKRPKDPTRLFHQSGVGQKGWTNTSSYLGKTKKTLTDEEMARYIDLYYPLREYILTRFPQQALDPLDPNNKEKVSNRDGFTFLGVNTVPAAIDVSQWGYECTLYVLDEEDKTDAEYTAKARAGILKDIHVADFFLGNIYPCRAIMFLGMTEDWRASDRLAKWFGLLADRATVILCAVDEGIDWSDCLRGLNVEFIGEPKNGYIFIAVKHR